MSVEHLKWRYATKQFDPEKKIPETEFHEIIEALRLAPSSYGLQPWKFLVVKNVKLRNELRPHAWNQSQITDASHLVVLCVRKSMDPAYIARFVETLAKSRGVALEALKEYQQMMLGSTQKKSPAELLEWMRNQVYIALGLLLAECAYRKIDTCPMEGFNPVKFDEILRLQDSEFHSVVLCALGYRAGSDQHAANPKVRFPMNEVISEI